MRGMDIAKEIYEDILKSKVWADQGVKVNLKESTEVSEEVEAIEEETHVCPLCESTLEEPISEEKIEEHVNSLVDVVLEAFGEGVDLESLDEEVDEEDSEEQED